MENPFNIRRISDPQGVIDDLVGQTTRQAVGIRTLEKEIERLKTLLADNNMDCNAEPLPKKGKKISKKED